VIGLLRMILVGIPATLWYGSQAVWLGWRKSDRLPCRCPEIARGWARAMLRAAGVKVVLENAEAINPEHPQILVANHVSWFDVVAIAGFVPGAFRFVAKKELERVPVFGPAWKACGHISVDRHDHQRAVESLAEARRVLERDRPTVILFAEGTRSLDGELRPFKKGAFVLAIQTGVEVVPAAVLGSYEVMRKGSWMIRTGRTVTVRFGAPIPVQGLEMEDRDALTRQAHDAVAALLSQNPN
jgi:1-acyl-sn-glycerol-3-phosphate acyltransferase